MVCSFPLVLHQIDELKMSDWWTNNIHSVIGHEWYCMTWGSIANIHLIRQYWIWYIHPWFKYRSRKWSFEYPSRSDLKCLMCRQRPDLLLIGTWPKINGTKWDLGREWQWGTPIHKLAPEDGNDDCWLYGALSWAVKCYAEIVYWELIGFFSSLFVSKN